MDFIEGEEAGAWLDDLLEELRDEALAELEGQCELFFSSLCR